jgi:hypothetical protein
MNDTTLAGYPALATSEDKGALVAPPASDFCQANRSPEGTLHDDRCRLHP